MDVYIYNLLKGGWSACFSRGGQPSQVGQTRREEDFVAQVVRIFSHTMNAYFASQSQVINNNEYVIPWS